jgi:hypothetical protein
LFFFLKGARIGGHFIRSCADDRCDIQLGFGSYVESKCCYNDLCNDEKFFFPNGSNSTIKSNRIITITVTIVTTLLISLLKLLFNF